MSNELYKIAKTDQEERKKALEAARAAAVAPPVAMAAAQSTVDVKPEIKPETKPVLGKCDSNVPVSKPEVKPSIKPERLETNPLDDTGKPWEKVSLKPKQSTQKSDRGGLWDRVSDAEDSEDGGAEDYDDVGSDDDWVEPSKRTGKENSDKATTGAKAAKSRGSGSAQNGPLRCCLYPS